VGRSRQKTGFRADRGYYYAIFDEGDKRTRHILIHKHELDYKITKRGRVSRSPTEKDVLLEQLWQDKLRTLEKPAQPAKKPSQSLSQAFESYLRIQTPLLSKNSLIHIRSALTPFVEMCGDVPAIKVNADLISEFTAYLKKKDLRPITINSYLIALGTFLNWLVEQGLIDKRPKIKKVKYTKKFPVIYTRPELKALEGLILQKIKDGGRYQRRWSLVYRFFMIARFTGARVGELVHLRWEQIDLEKRIITIKETENQQIKGGVERGIPINSDFYQYLKNLRRQSETYYLPDQHNNPFWSDTDPITRTFKRLIKEMGIQKQISPIHAFRYTFATELLSKGVPLVKVQKILGHKKIETTMIYLNADEVGTKEAVEMLDR